MILCMLCCGLACIGSGVNLSYTVLVIFYLAFACCFCVTSLLFTTLAAHYTLLGTSEK